MDCYKPLRIKNQYTGQWLHVNCRSCDACLIKSANNKAFQLSETIKQFKYAYFITLTYDNDSVPYIRPGYQYIFRGQDIDDIPEVVGWFDDLINWDDDFKFLVNHHVYDAVGVLWYYDVQLFLKRFRKYINKHYGKEKRFIYFCVGEYGTFYGRPHFHIVICSDGLSMSEVQNAAFSSWTYHDWNRFFKNGQNEACKVCTESCAGYISSYVNSNSSNIKISLYKSFCQKTRRSKSLYYGLDKQIYEEFQRDVSGIFKGLVYEGSRKVFYHLYSESKDNVSFRLFPSRYLLTWFHKFKEWNSLSFNDKFSRASNIVEICAYLKNLKLPLSTPVNGRVLSSLDLSFFRAYIRFLGDNEWFVKEFQFFLLYHYVWLMDKVLTYYHHCVLYEQFKSYEVLGKDNYYLSLIDTCVENGDSYRRLKIFPKLDIKDFSIKKNLDLNCPPLIRHEMDVMCQKYKRRLLPKHLNDASNLLKYY